MTNVDEVNKNIKKDLDKYSKLNNIFSKIYESESQLSEKRKEYFELLFQIRENDNEGLNKIYNLFREEMKKLEKEREKIYLKTLKDLIIPIVSDVYPNKLKKLKNEVEIFKTERKNFERINASSESKQKSEEQFGKTLATFEKNKIMDNKYLIMQYIYSELKYHTIKFEKMANLYYEITNIEPHSYMKSFGENLGIYNYNFDQLGFNMEEIEKKEKRKKQKEDNEKEEVYQSDEDNDKDDTSLKGTKSKSSTLKNSSIKKKKKKKNAKISENEDEDKDEDKTTDKDKDEKKKSKKAELGENEEEDKKNPNNKINDEI